jgi:hypothetical protein
MESSFPCQFSVCVLLLAELTYRTDNLAADRTAVDAPNADAAYVEDEPVITDVSFFDAEGILLRPDHGNG